MITAIAGGVGGARMLRALGSVVDPSEVTAVVNTGDDVVMHGLRISPDLDTVTYTLAGAINAETGWGLAGESWQAMGELRALSEGRLGWFSLGDHDLGTHLYRTSRIHEGATLSEVTAEIARRWGLSTRILPMSDDRVETRIVLAGPDGAAGEEIGFQDYFVGRRHEVPVASVRFDGIGSARPAPGVLEAIAGADVVVCCPSNPLVSIAPVVGVPGVLEALVARRDDVVAISPIIAGRALKGPADRLLAELGHESSVAGVARMWAPWVGTLVVDEADAGRRAAVEAEGVRCVVAPTVMTGPVESSALARTVLGAAPRPGAGR
jgi:LPPG:FO 2-phospho-L-lactate transferase